MGRLENWLDLVFHPFLEEAVQESRINVQEEARLILNAGLHVRQAPEMFENKSHISSYLQSLNLFSKCFFIIYFCDNYLPKY